MLEGQGVPLVFFGLAGGPGGFAGLFLASKTSSFINKTAFLLLLLSENGFGKEEEG